VDYLNLGPTDLKISRIALGCMSYGVAARAWRLSGEVGRPFIRRALDLGITLFDTADMYGGGESEQMLGKALTDFAKRDDAAALDLRLSGEDVRLLEACYRPHAASFV
jgi:1-deoxyxylulose-5-phosphate synthase